MSCSALIGSAPSICARRRRERLAKTLAPVGPQAPPALRSARLVAVAALRAGPSCGLPGRAASVRQPVHYVSEHLSTISTVDTPLAGGEGRVRGASRTFNLVESRSRTYIQGRRRT